MALLRCESFSDVLGQSTADALDPAESPSLHPWCGTEWEAWDRMIPRVLGRLTLPERAAR